MSLDYQLHYDQAMAAAREGRWEDAMVSAARVPANWNLYSHLASYHEMPSAIARRVVQRLRPSDASDFGVTYLTSKNKHLADAETLNAILHKTRDRMLTKIIQQHPNFRLTPEHEGLLGVARFWNDYERAVSPDHFATVKSWFSGKPERVVDHRGRPSGQVDYSHTHAHQEAYRRAVRASVETSGDDPWIAEEDRPEFKFIGGRKHVQVYRGVAGEYAKRLRKAAQLNPETGEVANKTLRVPCAEFSSWSTDPEVARSFAKRQGKGIEEGHGLIIRRWMPVGDLLHSGFHHAFPLQEHVHPGEAELVFAHHEPHMRVPTSAIWEYHSEEKPASRQYHTEDSFYRTTVAPKPPKQPKSPAPSKEPTDLGKSEADVFDGVSDNEAQDLAHRLGVDLSQVSLEEWRRGVEHEREHADVSHEPLDIAKIAWAHLREDPAYYTKLEQCVEPVAKGLKEVALAGALGLGSMASRAAPEKPAQKQPAEAWPHEGLDPGLHPIASLESNWGQNTAHAAHSKGSWHTARGVVGLKARTGHEEYKASPELQKRFPALHDPAAFESKFNADKVFYNHVASSHWRRLVKRFGDEKKAAYAWRWGWGAAAKAKPGDVDQSPYVKEYLKRVAPAPALRKAEGWTWPTGAYDQAQVARDAPASFIDELVKDPAVFVHALNPQHWVYPALAREDLAPETRKLLIDKLTDPSPNGDAIRRQVSGAGARWEGNNRRPKFSPEEMDRLFAAEPETALMFASTDMLPELARRIPKQNQTLLASRADLSPEAAQALMDRPDLRPDTAQLLLGTRSASTWRPAGGSEVEPLHPESLLPRAYREKWMQARGEVKNSDEAAIYAAMARSHDVSPEYLEHATRHLMKWRGDPDLGLHLAASHKKLSPESWDRLLQEAGPKNEEVRRKLLKALAKPGSQAQPRHLVQAARTLGDESVLQHPNADQSVVDALVKDHHESYGPDHFGYSPALLRRLDPVAQEAATAASLRLLDQLDEHGDGRPHLQYFGTAGWLDAASPRMLHQVAEHLAPHAAEMERKALADRISAHPQAPLSALNLLTGFYRRHDPEGAAGSTRRHLERVAIHTPDSVHPESTQVKTKSLGRLRKVRDLIQSLDPVKGEVSPKKLPPGDWSAGRMPNGNISAARLQQVIDTTPSERWNLSHAKWDGAQRHSDEPSRVLQINLSDHHVERMKDAGVWETFRRLHDESYNDNHPVTPHTIGWVRYTRDPPSRAKAHGEQQWVRQNLDAFRKALYQHHLQRHLDAGMEEHNAHEEAVLNAHDEEVGLLHRHLVAQAAGTGIEPPSHEELSRAVKAYGVDGFLSQLGDKGVTFKGLKSSHAASIRRGAPEALHPYLARARELNPSLFDFKTHTPQGPGYHVDEVQSDFGQAFIKGRDKVTDPKDPEHRQKISQILFGGRHPNEVLSEAFMQHLRDTGHHESEVQWHTPEVKAVLSRQDTSRQLPGHFQVTYRDVPQKMGAEPSQYGRLQTQSARQLQGKPTWSMRVRKHEGDAALPPFLHQAVGQFAGQLGDVTSSSHMAGRCMKVATSLSQQLDGLHGEDSFGDMSPVKAFPVQMWDAPPEVAENPLAHGHYVTRVEHGPDVYHIDLTAAQFPELGHVGPAVHVGKSPSWHAFEGMSLWTGNAPLSKMALKDIAVGQTVPTRALTGQTFDYSHLLPKGLRADYQLTVDHQAAYHQVSSSFRRRGQTYGLGSVVADIQTTPDGGVLRMAKSHLHEAHRGKGVGSALYEAVMAHAYNALGATAVAGGGHSSNAEAVHRRLAAKHGLDYQGAKLNPGAQHGEGEEGADDLAYGRYRYLLKSELTALPRKLVETYRAARAMAGLVEAITDEDAQDLRLQLWLLGDDFEAVALAAVGLPDDPPSRRGLRALTEGQISLAKSEVKHLTGPVTALTSTGADVAAEVAEALDTAVPSDLEGRHTAGSFFVETKSGRWLLKTAEAPGAIRGLHDDDAPASAREAAFYAVASTWGLGADLPRSEWLSVGGLRVAAIHWLSSRLYRPIQEAYNDAPARTQSQVEAYRQSGRLWQWAVLDWVLGNGDRHAHNILLDGKSGEIKLIDQGSAFAGEHFQPASDWRAFVPWYLRSNADGEHFNTLPPARKLALMPSLPSHQTKAMKAWLQSLNPEVLAETLKTYGIDSRPMVARLRRLQDEATATDLDGYVNRLWVEG